MAITELERSTSKTTGRASLLDLNLPQLQNLIKRDPISYREDFLRQWRHFLSNLEIVKLNPSHELENFAELVLFIAHVSHCYTSDIKSYAPELMALLREHYSILLPDTRKAMVQSLMLLRSKNLIEQSELLPLFFFLFRCRDKQLREMLNTYIITDIKTANSKCKNNKLNKSLQNYMYTMIVGGGKGQEKTPADATMAEDTAAKYSLDICIELFRKNIWNDNKTVNIIAEACLSPYNKVLVAAVKFFLGTNKAKTEDEEEDEDVPDMQQLQFRAAITKKSKNQRARLERAKKQVKKAEKKSSRAESFNFCAFHLLHDPQGLSEKLYSRLVKPNSASSTADTKIVSTRELKFEIRLMIMNFISRIIGIHKLILLNFYPNLIRYLKPHQQDITQILAICAQASHNLVPPDAIQIMIKAIMDNFAMDSYAPEVIAAGLNSIREICSRCPLAMEEEVLAYLVSFKTHRDKGVMMAARSLIALFREVNPEILPRKERGKVASMAVISGKLPKLAYGQNDVAEGVAGVDLLDKAGSNGQEVDVDDDSQWMVASDSEDDEGEWVAVSSDEQDALSDNDESEVETEADEEPSNANEDEKEELKNPRIDTTRILTPADFARMKELKEQAESERLSGTGKRARPPASDEEENLVETSTIIGYRKKKKQSKEERLACIEEGRKDREKFGSRRGKERGSTTNREKSKKKNNMMMVHKRSVKAKKKLSLRDKQKRLRAHIDHQKKQI